MLTLSCISVYKNSSWKSPRFSNKIMFQSVIRGWNLEQRLRYRRVQWFLDYPRNSFLFRLETGSNRGFQNSVEKVHSRVMGYRRRRGYSYTRHNAGPKEDVGHGPNSTLMRDLSSSHLHYLWFTGLSNVWWTHFSPVSKVPFPSSQ